MMNSIKGIVGPMQFVLGASVAINGLTRLSLVDMANAGWRRPKRCGADLDDEVIG